MTKNRYQLSFAHSPTILEQAQKAANAFAAGEALGNPIGKPNFGLLGYIVEWSVDRVAGEPDSGPEPQESFKVFPLQNSFTIELEDGDEASFIVTAMDFYGNISQGQVYGFVAGGGTSPLPPGYIHISSVIQAPPGGNDGGPKDGQPKNDPKESAQPPAPALVPLTIKASDTPEAGTASPRPGTRTGEPLSFNTPPGSKVVYQLTQEVSCVHEVGEEIKLKTASGNIYSVKEADFNYYRVKSLLGTSQDPMVKVKAQALAEASAPKLTIDEALDLALSPNASAVGSDSKGNPLFQHTDYSKLDGLTGALPAGGGTCPDVIYPDITYKGAPTFRSSKMVWTEIENMLGQEPFGTPAEIAFHQERLDKAFAPKGYWPHGLPTSSGPAKVSTIRYGTRVGDAITMDTPEGTKVRGPRDDNDMTIKEITKPTDKIKAMVRLVDNEGAHIGQATLDELSNVRIVALPPSVVLTNVMAKRQAQLDAGAPPVHLEGTSTATLHISGEDKGQVISEQPVKLVSDGKGGLTNAEPVTFQVGSPGLSMIRAIDGSTVVNISAWHQPPTDYNTEVVLLGMSFDGKWAKVICKQWIGNTLAPTFSCPSAQLANFTVTFDAESKKSPQRFSRLYDIVASCKHSCDVVQIATEMVGPDPVQKKDEPKQPRVVKMNPDGSLPGDLIDCRHLNAVFANGDKVIAITSDGNLVMSSAAGKDWLVVKTTSYMEELEWTYRKDRRKNMPLIFAQTVMGTCKDPIAMANEKAQLANQGAYAYTAHKSQGTTAQEPVIKKPGTQVGNKVTMDTPLYSWIWAGHNGWVRLKIVARDMDAKTFTVKTPSGETWTLHHADMKNYQVTDVSATTKEEADAKILGDKEWFAKPPVASGAGINSQVAARHLAASIKAQLSRKGQSPDDFRVAPEAIAGKEIVYEIPFDTLSISRPARPMAINYPGPRAVICTKIMFQAHGKKLDYLPSVIPGGPALPNDRFHSLVVFDDKAYDRLGDNFRVVVQYEETESARVVNAEVIGVSKDNTVLAVVDCSSQSVWLGLELSRMNWADIQTPNGMATLLNWPSIKATSLMRDHFVKVVRQYCMGSKNTTVQSAQGSQDTGTFIGGAFVGGGGGAGGAYSLDGGGAGAHVQTVDKKPSPGRNIGDLLCGNTPAGMAVYRDGVYYKVASSDQAQVESGYVVLERLYPVVPNIVVPSSEWSNYIVVESATYAWQRVPVVPVPDDVTVRVVNATPGQGARHIVAMLQRADKTWLFQIKDQAGKSWWETLEGVQVVHANGRHYSPTDFADWSLKKAVNYGLHEIPPPPEQGRPPHVVDFIKEIKADWHSTSGSPAVGVRITAWRPDFKRFAVRQDVEGLPVFETAATALSNLRVTLEEEKPTDNLIFKDVEHFAKWATAANAVIGSKGNKLKLKPLPAGQNIGDTLTDNTKIGTILESPLFDCLMKVINVNDNRSGFLLMPLLPGTTPVSDVWEHAAMRIEWDKYKVVQQPHFWDEKWSRSAGRNGNKPGDTLTLWTQRRTVVSKDGESYIVVGEARGIKREWVIFLQLISDTSGPEPMAVPAPEWSKYRVVSKLGEEPTKPRPAGQNLGDRITNDTKPGTVVVSRNENTVPDGEFVVDGDAPNFFLWRNGAKSTLEAADWGKWKIVMTPPVNAEEIAWNKQHTTPLNPVPGTDPKLVGLDGKRIGATKPAAACHKTTHPRHENQNPDADPLNPPMTDVPFVIMGIIKKEVVRVVRVGLDAPVVTIERIMSEPLERGAWETYNIDSLENIQVRWPNDGGRATVYQNGTYESFFTEYLRYDPPPPSLSCREVIIPESTWACVTKDGHHFGARVTRIVDLNHETGLYYFKLEEKGQYPSWTNGVATEVWVMTQEPVGLDRTTSKPWSATDFAAWCDSFPAPKPMEFVEMDMNPASGLSPSLDYFVRLMDQTPGLSPRQKEAGKSMAQAVQGGHVPPAATAAEKATGVGSAAPRVRPDHVPQYKEKSKTVDLTKGRRVGDILSTFTPICTMLEHANNGECLLVAISGETQHAYVAVSRNGRLETVAVPFRMMGHYQVKALRGDWVNENFMGIVTMETPAGTKIHLRANKQDTATVQGKHWADDIMKLSIQAENGSLICVHPYDLCRWKVTAWENFKPDPASITVAWSETPVRLTDGVQEALASQCPKIPQPVIVQLVPEASPPVPEGQLPAAYGNIPTPELVGSKLEPLPPGIPGIVVGYDLAKGESQTVATIIKNDGSHPWAKHYVIPPGHKLINTEAYRAIIADAPGHGDVGYGEIIAHNPENRSATVLWESGTVAGVDLCDGRLWSKVTVGSRVHEPGRGETLYGLDHLDMLMAKLREISTDPTSSKPGASLGQNTK